MLDVEKFVSGLHDYLGRAFAPIVKRLEVLESRAPEKGEKGDKGDPGKDADVDQAAIIAEVAKLIPAPRDGKDGRDAPTLEEVVAAVMPSIQKRLGEIPPPKDGIDGKSITLADVEPMLKSMQAEWALDFERRAQALFQKAVDAIPKPKDGKDGIGWDDMTVEHDGKRTVTLKWMKDTVEHSADIVFPCVLDVGFWRDGMEVEKGDGVTFGGSYWIAQEPTATKPEVGNPAWRLAVRKGRDGKRD